MLTPPRIPSAPALSGFYLLYFGTVGITLPFLPAYFGGLGFSGGQVGVLLALSPLFALVAPPLFGHLADRSGRPDRVLTLLSLGALLGFSPLLVARSFPAVLGAMAAYACFASSITMVVDSLALHRVSARGGSYANLRVWGSVGFVISSVAFGQWVEVIDHRTVFIILTGLGLFTLWSFGLRSQHAPAPVRSLLEGVRLLRDRDLALLLAATCLHWMAFAPFNGMLSIHVLALGLPPSVVGQAAGLGVIAEVGVMLCYARIAERFAPRHVLAFSFAVTVLRWLGMAWATSAAWIIGLTALHGLSFGAFYVASVGYIARRVPAHLRSSGQALYVAITFGLGGLIGYPAAGAAYDLLGGNRLYLLAAGLQIVTVVMVLRLKPADSAREFPPTPPRPEEVRSA